MKQTIKLNQLLRRLLLLVYPPKCYFCGCVMREDICLCQDCANALLFTHVWNQSQPGRNYSLCYSACFYAEPLRQAFHRYKFGGHYHYSKLFGQWMADVLMENEPEPFDCITWVPLHPFRRWRRGYDQARLLAQEVAGRAGYPLIPTIKKIRYTAAQSGTATAGQRKCNVKDAYRPLDGVSLQDKRILLVDDIITTGSTLENAAAALLAAGAAEVVCLTLARSHG